MSEMRDAEPDSSEARDEPPQPDSRSVELYHEALEQMRYHGNTLWQMFTAFLLAHTLLLGFILQLTNSIQVARYHAPTFIASGAGVVLSAIWLIASLRFWDYYDFYLVLARAAEPSDRRLLADTRDFQEGRTVVVRGKGHRLGLLARVFRVRRATDWLIAMFVVVYLSLFSLTGPWFM